VGAGKDWVWYAHGKTVRGKEKFVASDKGPGCDVETARCLGSLVLGIDGSNGSYCRVLVGLKIRLGKREPVKGEGGHHLITAWF
jgi:hypothetical protein